MGNLPFWSWFKGCTSPDISTMEANDNTPIIERHPPPPNNICASECPTNQPIDVHETADQSLSMEVPTAKWSIERFLLRSSRNVDARLLKWMASSQLFWDLTLDAKMEDSKRTELSIYRELVDRDRFSCCHCRSTGKLYCCGKPCRLGKNPHLSWIKGTPRYILRNAVQVCCAKFDAGLTRAKRREDEEFAMTRFDPIDELTPAGVLRHTVPIPPGSVKVMASGFLLFSVCCPTEVEIEYNGDKGSLRRLEGKSKRIAFLHWHPHWGRFTISVSYANAPRQRGAPPKTSGAVAGGWTATCEESQVIASHEE